MRIRRPRPSQDAGPGADNEAPVGAHALVGGLWSTSAVFGPYAFTLATSIVGGRILGPELLGRQSFIAFAMLTATTVCAAGLPVALNRASAEALGMKSAGSIIGLETWAWRVVGVATVFGTAAMLAAAAWGAAPRTAWIFAAVGVAAGILHKVPGSILAGTQNWRLNSLGIVLCGAVGAVATIVVLALGGGITGMIAASAATTSAVLVWALVCVRPVLRPLRAQDASALPELRRRASRFGLAASISVILTFVVGQRSELFFLNHHSSNAQIAFYSIAFAAVTMLQTLPVGMTNVVSPTFARFFGAGQMERIRSGFSRALRLTLLISIPITAAGIVLGPPLITLAYGSKFADTDTVFRILVLSVPLAPLGALCAGLLVGYGKMRLPIVVASIAGAADVTAAALLVPRYDAIGAAVANETAAVTATAIQLVYSIRLLHGVEFRVRQFARMFVASVVAAALAQGVLELGSGLPFFLLALVVGAGTLAALAVLLRVLPHDDAEWLAVALHGTKLHNIGRIFRLVSQRPTADEHEPSTTTTAGRRGVSAAATNGQADAVILLYHRIATASTGGGMAVPPSRFAEHLDALRSTFRPAALADLLDWLARGAVPPQTVVITFDDGYLDNLLEAKPLLAREQIPATVFVVSGYVGSGRSFWWDDLERVCSEPELPPSLELVVEGRARSWPVPDQDRRQLFRELRGVIGRVEEPERRELLEQLRGWSRTKTVDRVETMSSEQLRELADGEWVDIGAHTVTHPRLTDVPGRRQLDEIQQSRRQLADLLGRDVPLFSYPFGAHDRSAVESARRAGVTCACTTVASGVRATDDPFRLPRVAVDEWSGDDLIRRLALLCGWTGA